MFIQSKDPAHPVLLFLHGGMPEYFLTERYPTGLENDFTVAWWEQRGAGLSYRPGIPPETMTLEQFIADSLSVTSYLRDRFGQEKIYLMAHSGGTFIGLQAVARAPEPYHAYIGAAQAVNRLGVGTTHDMKSVLSGIFWPSVRSPQYTAAEKIQLWRGKLSRGRAGGHEQSR